MLEMIIGGIPFIGISFMVIAISVFCGNMLEKAVEEYKECEE
jgi:hypothetical protein